MGYVTRHRIAATVTATGGGAQTFYTPETLSGELLSVRYRRGTPSVTTSGIASGAKLVFTGEALGTPLLTITTASSSAASYYPRAYAMDTSGVQLGYSSAGTPPGIPVPIPLAQERIKVVVTSGGQASNGGTRVVLDFWVDGV